VCLDVEGGSLSSSNRDTAGTSPPSDRKKHRRKKSVNQKGDAAAGQSDGNALFHIYDFISCCCCCRRCDHETLIDNCKKPEAMMVKNNEVLIKFD